MMKNMEFMTRTEVSKHLRVSERTVDRWLVRGLIRGYKLGEGRTALLRISKADVEQFLAKGLVKGEKNSEENSGITKNGEKYYD